MNDEFDQTQPDTEPVFNVEPSHVPTRPINRVCDLKFNDAAFVMTEDTRETLDAFADKYVRPMFEPLPDPRFVRAEFALAKPAKTELSSRERQVLNMLWSGITSKAVAEELGLSPKTVASFVANAERKFGVTTPIALCREALKRGVLVI